MFFRALLVLLFSATQSLAGSQTCSDLTTSNVEMRIEQLQEEIRFHNGRYYKDHRPQISDSEYDRLFAELIRLEQCFPAYSTADSPTHAVASDSAANSLTLRHQHPMLSLNSSTGPETVEALLRRVAAEEKRPGLLVQPKVDGLPVELVFQSGQLISASTRGDGNFGAEVTERVKEIPGIPKVLSGRFPAGLTVRGEVYADRELMAKALACGRKSYATPRHFAAATLKSLHPEPLAVAALRFFPFEWVDADHFAITSDQSALQMLSVFGFEIRPSLTRQVQSLEQIRALYEKYLAERNQLSFAADGIVVKVDELFLRRKLGEGARAPFWAAAWKFPPETARTVVRAIRWKEGRTGRLTPVAEVAPVIIGGVRVSNVSLQNEETVKRLGIAVGCYVVVALVSDIIPQVLAVEKPQGQTTWPDDTSAGAPTLENAACLRVSPQCKEQFLARAAHFVSKEGLNIQGLGLGRLRKLVEAELVSDLPSLFRLEAEAVAKVDGFGPASAGRITAALHKVKRPAPFRLLTALGIPGVGPTAARRVTRKLHSLDKILSPQQEETDDEVTIAKVRRFFGSAEGQRLREGLRQAGLL
jgi:DNA ligase (NAD+)